MKIQVSRCSGKVVASTLFDGDGVPVAMATGRERAKVDPGFAMFALLMSRGPCLCEDIDPSDRPCLTCEAVEASPPPSVQS